MPRTPPSNKTLGHSVWFWVAMVAAVALVVLLMQSQTFTDVTEKVTDWAEEVMAEYPVAGAGVFFIVSAISAMIGFASSVVLVPAANEVWGKPVTFLLLWGGWLAGAVLAYGIGRLARPLLARIGLQKKLEEYQEFISKRTPLWLVLLFCLAVPSEIPGYLLGGVHYPFLKFLVAMGSAEAIYALGVIIAGDKLLNADPIWLAVAAGGMIVVALGAGLLFRRFRKRKSG